MLFRTKNGKLVEINKSDFKDDKLYFTFIKNVFVSTDNKDSTTDNSKQLMQHILSKL